jgi:hypothetical protein
MIRYYTPEDIDALLYFLSVSYARSKAGERAGASGAGKKGKPSPEDAAQQRAFMEAHQPIWLWLLANAQVRLACDIERPDSIYAWAITSEPNVVHAIGAKYDTVKLGFAKEMLEDLLGDRLTSMQVVTLELPKIPGERPGGTLPGGAIMSRPARWYTDPTWLLTRMIGDSK